MVPKKVLLAVVLAAIMVLSVAGVVSSAATKTDAQASTSQASNVQVLFFTSPLCGDCAQVKPLAQAAAAKYGVSITFVDVSTGAGSREAMANSVKATPTIIISGAKSTRLVGVVSQAQIEAAIQ